MTVEPKLFDALVRLKSAVDSFDERAPEILAFHAAIEGELDYRLAELLPNPKRLLKLGYGQKVSVWASLQAFDDDLLDVVVTVLLRFNDLRNTIAHRGSKKQVDGAVRSLMAALPADAAHREKNQPRLAAAFIFGALNGAGRTLAIQI